MASNFPNMGGAGQMMPQQQQQQQLQQQQQQQQRNQLPAQVQQMVFTKIQENTGPVTGWQSSVIIQERISTVFNFIGNLRLIAQAQTNPQSLQKYIEMAVGYEKELFEKSTTKEQYKREVGRKQAELHEHRVRVSSTLQQQLTAQAQAQAQQQLIMNQTGMQNQQLPRGMPQQTPQQGFQHLQHQMQASPLPPQQPQPMPGAPSNENPQQNMNSNPQFQPNNMPQQPQNGPQRTANGPQPNAAETQMIGREAMRMFSEASAEEKNTVRQNMQSRMDPSQWQKYTSQGTDPALVFFRQQAYHKWRVAQGQQNPQGQQPPLSQQPQNGSAVAPAMQQQRSMNPSPMNGQSQPPTSMGGTDMAFMENLIGQQQQAGVMAQEAGQMVVPVSGPRNGTPQPNVVMPGQSMNINDQRSATMANQRGQVTQAQMFNAQQNQRMQQAQAQQQSQQAQARANAAAKAQQMGLQGQPGGMGPMPPQQSPAMNTLNTPLRTPSQQMNHPEGMRMNANPQFNQSLDPRFMQGMQRQMGPGNAMNGLNPAMFQGMPPEQQKQFAALPPDKLNEVVQKWHAAQNARMQGQQMPMPGGNQQPRPGQLGPQAGQFTPQQQALNQFMMANPGQRPPPSLMAGMTPQQQLYLQQSMAQANQNAMQRRPDNPQFDQRTLMQLDNMPFPPGVLNNPQIPRGIPPEVKKWGQLKHWLATNGNIPQELMENLKNMQRLHYLEVIRRTKLAANQQVPHGMGMNPGAPGGQNQMPVVTPGMAAPVAPMGQAPMQIPNGMNMPPQGLRQPTPQEILAIRNHPTGRFINYTDEQLRAFIMRNQAHQLQMQHQQHQQRLQMANQIAQMNAQQPRPNAPNGPANGNQGPPAQQPPVQATQQKAPTSEPAAAASAANANRARQQPQPNQKPTPAQTSSPAQPPKNNLKRASSDDVVEVPNPNSQQRPQQQPAQKPPGLRTLPPDALAKLTPDQRKQYEAMLRQQYARQQNINSDDAVKLREMMAEESQRAMEHLPDIPMDPETKKTMVNLLRDIVNPTNNLWRAIHKWYAVTHDDNRARIFFRTRNRLAKQFKDKDLREVKDVFSIRPAEVEQALNMLRGMIKDLTDRFPAMKKSEAPPNTSVSQAPVPATQSSEAVPLNAANLQQQQQQLNKIHQRSNSRGSHPPAAPTSSQPPFPFGASSPHGQPIYNVKAPALTQENLHIPARKKQKPNSTPVQGQGTPGSTSSPQVSKAVSPEIKRQQQPTESIVPPKPALCCPDQECERHDVGFETEEELKRHKEEEHVRPLANPQQYVEESLAAILGLDPQGQPKKPATATNNTAPPMSTKMTATGSKQGQTPKIEAGTPAMASTPMNRQVSMNRQGSSADSKTTAAKPQPSTPMDISKSQKDNTTVSAQPVAEQVVDPWANATIDPNDLFTTFAGFESGAGGAISEMNVYRAITPNDTPESSKDGVSEPNSDISEGVNLDIAVDIFDDSWMPFGPTDTDALLNSNLNSFNASAGEDLTMFDEDIFVPQQSWDDMGDQSIFDKPFKFDTSLYSMDVE